VHFQKKDYDAAIDTLKNMTQLAPDFAPARALLAMCYFEKKLYIHSLSELNAAVNLDKSDYNSMYNIACIYSLQKKPAPALKWLERAIDNGFSEYDHMSKDSDLDNIRAEPKFGELAEKASRQASLKKEPAEEQAQEAAK
jgi:tetratricopeptide (TPR) repeat protein